MSEAEKPITLTINRAPDTPIDSTMADAREATRQARAKLTDAVAEQKAESATPEVSDKVPYEPDEDLESVEVKLPNGLLVEYGPPRNISLTMRVIKLLGESAESGVTAGIYRILLSIRTIDGVPAAPITSTIDAEKLANRIGDAGIDILTMVHHTHWKPLRLTALPVVKKNQRK